MLQFLKSRMLRHRADERVSNHSSSAFFYKIYNSIKVRRDILCVGLIRPPCCLSEAADTYRVPHGNEDVLLKKSSYACGTLMFYR